ncbi:GcrA cell cycle regulator [Sphingomonas histidinilytica]|jgi:GcrA cell cycle regulator|uniref:GcrA cell cycle regulator n=4 Tax=Rhizorhabdus histidinilytica TaxID=439228 RepID=A0A1T5CFL5_9SPHN|nr:GcrA family cell cycle regulator [Rhizorhabdus histidinilytica]MBO9378296.1 GcrA cell cycle regulator [Rhizorhabdus histidinilytica]QEH78869.1 GcrA cell cycle regulator [Sphingomonas sp. C8-2]SKB58136.1 GcrA cell cycle regulator [Rhizorhabdus histidinilytica]
MSWTEERIDQLKRLWGQGMTASQIADELGGVSRNAVIGKAHRLGLEARPSPVKGGDAAASGGSSPAAATPAPEKAAAPPPRPAPTPAPAPVSPPPAAAAPAPAPTTPQPIVRSIGPGGFQRQAPGEQSSPIPPAPPRRLVPAKPSAEMADKTSLLDLNDKVCKWPLGHPGEPDFHFCGEPINPGFPYCLEHCSVAYQAQLPRRDRRPPPPLPFGGPRVR